MPENFIPTVWAARLLASLETSLVYAQPGVVNREYEGEIRNMGDTVKIVSVGEITVKDYTRNSDMDSPETPATAAQMLTIDNGKYFHFFVDDVDKVQSRPELMAEYMREAANSLKKEADSTVAGIMAKAAGNTIGSLTTPKTDLGTEGKAYDYLVDLGVLLDENDTPEDGRWVIVPSWFHGLLLKDPRFVQASAAGEKRLASGKVGEAAGFAVMKSNQVPKATATTKYQIIAGHAIATSYADQINKVEAYRPEKRFGDAVKGLHLYGAKVVRAGNLAQLIANVPS